MIVSNHVALTVCIAFQLFLVQQLSWYTIVNPKKSRYVKIMYSPSVLLKRNSSLFFKKGLVQTPSPHRGGGADPKFLSQTSEILHAGLICDYLLIHRKKLGVGHPLEGGLTPPLTISEKFSILPCEVHPHPNFILFWPVNSVCGQTKGQI